MMGKIFLTSAFLLAFSVPAAGGSSYCSQIRDSDLRNYCRGNCGVIRDSDLRYFCRGRCSNIKDKDMKYLCKASKQYPGGN